MPVCLRIPVIRSRFDHWFIRVQGDGSDACSIPTYSLSLRNSSNCWSTAMFCFTTCSSLICSSFSTPTFPLHCQSSLAAEVSCPCAGKAKREGPTVPPRETGSRSTQSASVKTSWVGSQVTRPCTFCVAFSYCPPSRIFAGCRSRLCICDLRCNPVWLWNDVSIWSNSEVIDTSGSSAVSLTVENMLPIVTQVKQWCHGVEPSFEFGMTLSSLKLAKLFLYPVLDRNFLNSVKVDVAYYRLRSHVRSLLCYPILTMDRLDSL